MLAQWYDDQTGDKPTRDAVRVAYHGYIPEHATLTYIGDESRMTRYLGRMRWYDARLGRWLTRDPAGYVDGLNVYLFVRGNPLMFVDPTGLAKARKRGEIWETIKRTPGELWKAGTSVGREMKDGLNAVATEAIVLPQYYLGFKTIEEYSRISVFAKAQVGAEIEAARSPSGTPMSTGAAALSTLAIEPPIQTIRAITSGDLDEIERSSWTLALGGVSGLATKQFLLRNPGAVTAGATGAAAPRPNAPVGGAVKYGPHVKGPLPEDVVKTFRGGSYSETQLQAETTLYRVHGGAASELGKYWTRMEPLGPL